MGEHRPPPASEYRRHPPTAGRDHRMADGVDAAMQPMESPARYPASHSARGQTELAQLAYGHDTVLTRR
ncbi:MAG TPA: hypothetical protein VE401_02490 [Solirubrobacterales bacterium]|nr:hypothetical protein [Solirubrobacterales bacterium]